MTTEEKGIMADLFYFLRDHNDPPPADTEACAAFWEKAAEDIGQLVGGRWRNHPLALEAGAALYGYLGMKGQRKGGDSL